MVYHNMLNIVEILINYCMYLAYLTLVDCMALVSHALVILSCDQFNNFWRTVPVQGKSLYINSLHIYFAKIIFDGG